MHRLNRNVQVIVSACLQMRVFPEQTVHCSLYEKCLWSAFFKNNILMNVRIQFILEYFVLRVNYKHKITQSIKYKIESKVVVCELLLAHGQRQPMKLGSNQGSLYSLILRIALGLLLFGYDYNIIIRYIGYCKQAISKN